MTMHKIKGARPDATTRALALIAAAGLALTSASLAVQDQPEPRPDAPAAEAPSASQPSEEPPAPPSGPARQPTLDELLGLDPERPEETGEIPPPDDPSRTDLERRLSAEEVSEHFEQAVALMGDTARRLGDAHDTGIETQRMQDEIIRRLDMLIQSAERQRQEGGGSASSGSQDQDPQQQPAQPQGAAAQQAGAGDSDQEADPPGGQDPQMRPDVAARGAAWGNLPERVRDALLQGNADEYSSIYQRWTEAYYRRLAEEGNR